MTPSTKGAMNGRQYFYNIQAPSRNLLSAWCGVAFWCYSATIPRAKKNNKKYLQKMRRLVERKELYHAPESSLYER